MAKESFLETLKILAPGTPLREGLENILRGKTGALIVIGDDDKVTAILDGGFPVNCELTPTNLYELSKMDGAIILSNDVKKILYANTQLVPDRHILSRETGIRHRAAERTAKQIDKPVICISEKRATITLYSGEVKYVLGDTSLLLAKAGQALGTLEKYRATFDEVINNLNVLEFEDLVTLSDVGRAIQRAQMVLRVKQDIERYIVELGGEGRLVKMELEELVSLVEEENELIIKDYFNEKNRKVKTVIKEIRKLPLAGLLDLTTISGILGWEKMREALDITLSPCGYRILRRFSRPPLSLPSSVIDNLIRTFGNLQGIFQATLKELDKVEGIGKTRAHTISDGLKRIREQALLNKPILT